MLLVKPLSTALPVIEKRLGTKDVSTLGAFSIGDTLTLTVRAPRALGASCVVLRIAPDGGQARDLPLAFIDTEKGTDRYRLTLPMGALTQATPPAA